MDWTRSETLALADNKCTHCHGLGLRAERGGKSSPCACVFRKIFRICLKHFRHCQTRDRYTARIHLGRAPGVQGQYKFGMPHEEWCADFVLIARRVLSARQYAIFRFHYLLGADWKLCCRRLKIDRGTFFHECYRIEERCGRTFREVSPYALFPIDAYFGGVQRSTVVHPIFRVETATEAPPAAVRLRFPVKALRNLPVVVGDK